jgi:hypothetical protein
MEEDNASLAPRQEEEGRMQEDIETCPVPSPVAPISGTAHTPKAASKNANATFYENVFCGDVEGKLQVHDKGLLYSPYYTSSSSVHTPYDISWNDVTHREFLQETVKAGYKSYSTMLTLYKFKVSVFPSKEAIFSIRQAEEFERLQCDLDARGQGAPPPQPKTTTSTNVPEEKANMGADQEKEEEEEEDEVDWEDEREGDDDKNDLGQGWSTGDSSAVPNSTYYPVRCKGEVGCLILSKQHLQFVPDRYSVPVKTLPWASFAGKPFFSPFHYPRAQVSMHYHTTLNFQKKVGFDLQNHDVLGRLQEDMTARMRPFQNAPREKVPVPRKIPKAFTKTNSSSSFVARPQGGGGTSNMFKKQRVAPGSNEFTATDDDTISLTGGDDDHVEKPLVKARRVPYHRDEPRRRMFLLFTFYCCILMLAGLCLSIIFGYFFGPRRPREEYIRTKSPYDIVNDYLGTEAPTFAPEPESWQSEAVTMSRTTTPAPAGMPLEKPIPAPVPVMEEDTSRTITEPPATVGGFKELMNGGVRGSNVDLVTVVPTVAPVAPAPARSNRTVAELLTEESFDNGQALRSPGTPQQAAYLLTKLSGVEDSADSDSEIVQKFALSTLYYAMGGGDWNEGSTSWKSLKDPECLKEHIVCDQSSGEVIKIDMPQNHAVGYLPPEIGLLSEMTTINLRDNDLRGTIPTEIGLLSNLQVLDLSGNPNLEGTVPEEVMKLPLLTEIKAGLL